jgi:ribosomal protein S30
MAFCAEQRSQTPKIDIKELAKMWNIVKRDANQFEKYKALVVKN